MKDEIYYTIYYTNKCNGQNKIKETGERTTGYSTFHKVDDKIVELQQTVVANGEDDIDFELDNVIIHNEMPSYA